ncbi:MAG: hypothetical protein IPL65_17105 [Lewinellaceae bacterium]|nr:hypothetical protein [Lewinellaceae bacterium]
MSRQVRSYKENATKKGYRVLKAFVLAPEFTDDFINDCRLDNETELSLITADTLFAIYNTYVEMGIEKKLSINTLLRDVVIDKEMVIRSLKK